MAMNLNVLAGVGVTFVVIAIVLAFGGQILGDLRADQTVDSYQYNATSNGLEAVDTISSWLPTIALVVVAAIIIGIVVGYLAGGGKRG